MALTAQQAQERKRLTRAVELRSPCSAEDLLHVQHVHVLEAAALSIVDLGPLKGGNEGYAGTTKTSRHGDLLG